jgi:polysaccharide biosynthesis transport protein
MVEWRRAGPPLQPEGLRPYPMPDSFDLRRYVAVLHRRRWPIAAVIVVTLVGVLALSFLRDPVYTSETRVLMRAITIDPQLDRATPDEKLISPKTQQQLVLSTAVAARAGRGMRPPRSATRMLEQVDVTVLPETAVLLISFADSSPARAQAGASAFADAYLTLRQEQARTVLEQMARRVERQIADHGKELAALRTSPAGNDRNQAAAQEAQIRRDVLLREVQTLETQLLSLSTIDVTPGQIIEPASLPTSPTSPNHPMDAALGLALGLALGVGAAVVREWTADRMVGQDELARLLDRSVLATVPVTEAWRNRDEAFLVTAQEPESRSAEAYRALGMKMIVLAAKHDVRVVLVTSAAPGEGKTTTAANLAMVLAEAGKDVLLISADLRRPRLHDFFGLNNGAGLSTFLSDEAATWDVGQKAANLYVWSVSQRLLLLPSGPPVPRALKLLESDAMRNMLKVQRDSYDFVILDSSPTLSSADPLGLVPMVDAVLFVADAKRTSATSVSTARDQFEQVGGTIVGAVLNRAERRRGQSAYYHVQTGRPRWHAGTLRRRYGRATGNGRD